jgi:ketosteroid isomerase-like protein
MSQENIEIVARGFAHYQETGEFLEEIMAPNFAWDMSTFNGWPEKQVYEGVEGAREFMRAWLDAWDDWELEVVEVHDAGDKVAAVMRQRARSKSTGMEMDMSFVQVFTLEAGKETLMEMYSSREEGLAAVGLG